MIEVLVAQAIIPAPDPTGTTVTQQGNSYDIGGGQRSGDGANLFHSFSQFSLQQGKTANFLSNPSIQNIVTRVTGGAASIIDGRLQITGGNSNLFFVNPAGIFFGPNASLNVPASFTATTANAIGFQQKWLNAVGSNDYAVLQGSPTQLAFTASQLGAIVNLGNLTVATGQTLNLVGGTVLSTGNLTASEGQITIAAVPGNRLVRLGIAGSLLNLEIPLAQPATDVSPAPYNISPVSLPELLTGGQQGGAKTVTTNQQGDIVLMGSSMGIPANSGTAIVAGELDTSGQRGGTVRVMGDRVGLVNAQIQASGNQGGGTVLIGGNTQGQNSLLNASSTYVSSDSRIQADALQSGNGGQVVLWADQTTAFYGFITARGADSAASQGGFAEVSGKQNLIFRGNTDLSAAQGKTGTLLLDPTDIQIVSSVSAAQDPALPQIFAPAAPATSTISSTALQSQVGNVTLEATNNITIDSNVSLNFVTGGGAIAFKADADNSGAGSFQMGSAQSIITNGRSLTISGASVTLGNLDTSQNTAGTALAGSVTLSAPNSIQTGSIYTAAGAISAATNATATGGSVNIISSNSNIQTGVITTSATASSNTGTAIATAGAITLNAGSSIQTGVVASNAGTLTSATPPTTQGGAVSFTANNGNIAFGNIDSRGVSTAATGTGGNVSLTVTGGVIQGTNAGNTISTVGTSQGGSITIQHDGGPQNLPFVVGAAPANGTAGALNTGNGNIINAGNFPVLPAGGTAAGTPTGITIISVNQAPTLTVQQNLSGTLQNQSVSLAYAALAPQIQDANLDNTTLVVTAVNQGTLTINGNLVVPGVTVINPGDSIVYTPPTNSLGTITNAFAVRASDGVSFSAAPGAQISVQINAPVVNPGSNPGTVLRSPQPVQSSLLPDLAQQTPSALDLFCQATDIRVSSIENRFSREYEEYLGKPRPSDYKPLDACKVLSEIETATGVKPAVVYISFVPGFSALPKSMVEQSPNAKQIQPNLNRTAGDDQLELIAITATGAPIYKRIAGTTRAEVLKVARQMMIEITDPISRDTNNYQGPAQRLYQWLIQPLEAELQARKVKNLTFIMDTGLRAIPISALYDGQKFLVEKYSLGLMPSLSITDTRYQSLKQSQVLAMGASVFTDQKPLPAVPIELSSIAGKQWSGLSFLNEGFTLNNLKNQRQKQGFGIVHLATHAEFNPGRLANSYIQFWDTKLQLDQVRQLNLHQPPVQLLVLSACRTAIGDENTELGFAGLTYQMGVRSTLASLWTVDDEGTLALMQEFYGKLKSADIKAEALRQAQLAMIQGRVRVEGKDLVTDTGKLSLSSQIGPLDSKDLSSPYYWAAFTLIGNPW